MFRQFWLTRTLCPRLPGQRAEAVFGSRAPMRARAAFGETPMFASNEANPDSRWRWISVQSVQRQAADRGAGVLRSERGRNDGEPDCENDRRN